MFLTSNLFSFILACIFNSSTFSMEEWGRLSWIWGKPGLHRKTLLDVESTLMVSKLKHSAQMSPWKSKVIGPALPWSLCWKINRNIAGTNSSERLTLCHCLISNFMKVLIYFCVKSPNFSQGLKPNPLAYSLLLFQFLHAQLLCNTDFLVWGPLLCYLTDALYSSFAQIQHTQ